jgi:flagellar biogenesis protein FliO
MRFTLVFLSAMLCFSAWTANAKSADASDDAALLQAAEQMIHEGGRLAANDKNTVHSDDSSVTTAATDEADTPIQTASSKKAEQEPLFTSNKTDKTESSLVWRLVFSLALIAVVGGAILYSTKRWGGKRNKGGEKVRIEMLHQFHLGPKRSLALIRVAGEVALIGITDHSINMLKTVTLIDDELENIVGGQGFNNFLEDDFSVEDVRTALKARA